MKPLLSTVALCAALAISAGAAAQVPSGGPGSDAKANAALKAPHTVNDGGARRGRNSFTEKQARSHILKAGYQSVTGLAKGTDGVWRGAAMKNGVSVDVGMDYKGNVSEGAAPTAAHMTTATTTSGSMAAGSTMAATSGAAAGAAAVGAGMAVHHARAHHHRRHAASRCADPGPNGTACSGVDRNRNGVSDKEDRAIRAGSHP